MRTDVDSIHPLLLECLPPSSSVHSAYNLYIAVRVIQTLGTPRFYRMAISCSALKTCGATKIIYGSLCPVQSCRGPVQCQGNVDEPRQMSVFDRPESGSCTMSSLDVLIFVL